MAHVPPLQEPTWHALTAEETLAALAASREGLGAAEVALRLARVGPNALPPPPRARALLRLLRQFESLLILILLGAAALTAALGHWLDCAVILSVVVVNTTLGFLQEGRAERALAAVRAMLSPQASVRRQDGLQLIEVAALVPGDIVLLEAGDRVPADLRLFAARQLAIDEAALTGEAIPVDKQDVELVATTPLAERTNMAYSGTFVVRGQGTGVVVATGVATELGKITKLLGAVETLTTPLLRQMQRFARQLALIILSIAAAVFAIGAAVHQMPLADMFIALVGVSVAAIPEGLPAILTITLAIAVQRMAARHAIVRRLPAVETLGSVSIICSDKTGTLTRNEMGVSSAVTPTATFELTGEGYAPEGTVRRDGLPVDPAGEPSLAALAQGALLCNDARLKLNATGWVVEGDPMEGALLAFAARCGLAFEATRAAAPRRDVVPFDPEHRVMATLHAPSAGEPFIVLKGAPERVLRASFRADEAEANHHHAVVDALAARGERVLALAVKAAAAGQTRVDRDDLDGGFRFLGFVGLIDPPRAEAIEAIRACRSAGIRVKMITGDHPATARAIAESLGLDNTRDVLVGDALGGLDAAALRQHAGSVDVFARTSPIHKLKLVEALQQGGQIVAMTGDGVNDAPALKRADVGVAMGLKGTEVAKEAAQIVLADDNFASIVAAVKEGRTAYDNLRKAIQFLLPINGGESVSLLLALLFGLVMPITPIQILWVNMVSSLALALTLAFEPAEQDVMRRSPRSSEEPLLSGFLVWRIAFVSVLFAAGIFGVFALARAQGATLETARTMAVNALVAMEIFYLFSVRYLRSTSLTWQGALGTRPVLIGVALAVGLQFLFTYAPVLQAPFQSAPVSLTQGLLAIAAGLAVLACLEAEKQVRRALDRGGAHQQSSERHGTLP